MADIATLVLAVKSDGIEQATDSLDELTNSSKRVERQTKNTTSSFNNVDKAAQKTGGSFKAMKGATQQISYQLQDMAVQAQMGTSNFIILGQQGPQLASIFGPGGAVFGAFIAFGSMIAGTLYNSMTSAEVKTEDLERALDSLDKTVVRTKNNTLELSERIMELGQRSAIAAQAELITELSKTGLVIDESKKSLEEFSEEAAGFNLSALRTGMKQLEKHSMSIDQLLETGSYTRNIYNADQLANAVLNVQEAFQLTTPDAFKLVGAISKLDKKDISTYDNLQQTIDEIAASSAITNRSFVDFRDKVYEASDSIDLAQEQATLLNQALDITRTKGPQALAPITEGAEEAAEAFRDLENTHRNALLDMDQKEVDLGIAREKREDDAAKKREEREKLIADRQLKTMQDGIDKRLAAALAADDTEIERINNQLAQKLAVLEADRLSSVIMAEQKGQDTMAIEQRYSEATVALNSAAQEEIADILDQQRATDLEKQATYMSEWMRITSESMGNLDMLGFNMATSLQSNLAGAFESFVTGAKSAEESFKQLATGMAQALIHALSNMAAEWAAYWIVEKLMGKTAQASAGVAMTFNALAGQQLAAINAFAATAAIPIVGPGLAPAAAAGAVAATAPFVAATAALSAAATGARALGGQVRGGQSYLVGERGPELLTMGTSGRIATNENLKNAMGGGGVTIINNVDASGAGPDVDARIKMAMEESSAATIYKIQDLMKRRRFA